MYCPWCPRGPKNPILCMILRITLDVNQKYQASRSLSAIAELLVNVVFGLVFLLSRQTVQMRLLLATNTSLLVVRMVLSESSVLPRWTSSRQCHIHTTWESTLRPNYHQSVFSLHVTLCYLVTNDFHFVLVKGQLSVRSVVFVPLCISQIFKF